MPAKKKPEKVFRMTVEEFHKALSLRGITLSTQRIYRLMQEKKFPRIKILGSVYVKIIGSIDDFVAKYVVSEA